MCPKWTSCLICQNLYSKDECIGDISDIRNTHIMPEAFCRATGTSALAKGDKVKSSERPEITLRLFPHDQHKNKSLKLVFTDQRIKT